MSSQSKNLRELMDDFESIVDWFDQEDIDIDKAIAKFEEGTALAENIKKHLTEAKNKIEIVKNKFESRRSETISVDESEV